MRHLLPLLAALTLAALPPRQALALRAEADLKTCQTWYRRIERYSQLRRAGGSATQMERWRQARKVYEEKFRDARCHRWGRKLRE